MANPKPGRHGSGRAIHLLGPVDVEVDGSPLAVDTRKAIALLAYLAVADRPAARDVLAALLWPESDDAAARGALRRTLSVLNAGLGGRGLAIDRASVGLAGDWDIDVRRFRDLLAFARRHGHTVEERCATCLESLEEASALDRGEFMSGFTLRDSQPFDEWQLAESEAHRRDLAGVLERLSRARAAAAQWEAAIAAGRRWLELDPLHEPAHRLLMLVLARSGEQAAAIRQYRACVRVLDAELGVPPLDETTELYEAIRGGQGAGILGEGEPTGIPAHAEVRTAPLVGRGPALDALADAYRSIDGDGRLLVVEGEAGIGKTRLVEAIAERIRSLGGAVLEARAYAGESSIAFGPIGMLVAAGLERPNARALIRGLRPDIVEAATRIVPALSTVDGRNTHVSAEPLDALGRARAVEAVAEVLIALASGPAPGVFVIDDVDWADASTVELLAFLARRLRGRAVALVVTWRPSSVPDEVPNRLVAAATRDGLVSRVVLERLSRDDVAELVEAALGLTADDAFVDALFAESEGLPLYVAEVIAARDASAGVVPRGVLELLRSRIASVGDVAGQVLATAAVVGRSFDFETVRAASGRSEDETMAGLEELSRRGLVREVGTIGGDVRLDFTHGRLRDVAYESLGLVRRRLLHRRVAESLRARAAGGGDGRAWARIANHEAQAGRLAEAREAHLRAATQARSVFANREAREHLEAALAIGGAPTVELHRALGEVLTLVGDYPAAIGHLEAAAALSDGTGAWAIERGLALVHARLGDWSAAASHASAALEAAPDDVSIRALLLADRSAIAGRQGEPALAERFGRESLALAEGIGDAAGVSRACHVLGVLARGRGDLATAEALLERSLGASVAAPDPGLRVASLNTLGLVRADAGDHSSALGLLEEALALCERQGDRHRQAALENNTADVLRADGRRDEAMAHLKRAVAMFADIGGRLAAPEPEIWKLVEW